jgi:hypothetical protein
MFLRDCSSHHFSIGGTLNCVGWLSVVTGMAVNPVVCVTRFSSKESLLNSSKTFNLFCGQKERILLFV